MKVQILNAPESKITTQIPEMNHQMLDRETGNFVSQETKPNLIESSPVITDNTATARA